MVCRCVLAVCQCLPVHCSIHPLGEEKWVEFIHVEFVRFGSFATDTFQRIVLFSQLWAIQCRNVTTCDEVMEKANLSLYTARAFPSAREHKTVYH